MTPMRIWTLGLTLVLASGLTGYYVARNPGLAARTTSYTQSNVISESEARTVVERFFPVQLQSPKNKLRTYGFAAGNLDNYGLPKHIVAVYANGADSIVRILELRGNEFALVDESSVPGMSGTEPEVQLVDMNRDGRPTVVISLKRNEGGTDVWILRWHPDERELYLVSPVTVAEDGTFSSLLHNAVILDTTGSGNLDIVNTPEIDIHNIILYPIFQFDPILEHYIQFKTLKELYHIS